MTISESKVLKIIYGKGAPFGSLFAQRSNFNHGLFNAEAYFVTKYLNTSRDVLVIGAGNGREARPIWRQGHRIVCMDIGWIYCRAGENLFRAEGAQNVFFLQANMYDLPFRKESFDFVFFSVYSFAASKRFKMLQNIRFCLRPHGLVLLSCYTPLYKKLYKKLPKGRIFIAKVSELQREINLSGFKLLESRVDPVRCEYRASMLQLKSS